MRLLLSLALSTVLAGLVAVPAFADPGGLDPAPNPGEARIEVEFLTGMIPHHRGAIAMSQMALQKATTPEVRQMAQSVIDDQSKEVDQMTHWLKDWYNLDAPGGTMMPMSQMAEMAPMFEGQAPDMAGWMQRLESLSGRDFEVAYLSSMSDHHAMAVMMTGPVLASGWHEDLFRAAEHTAMSQGQEVAQIQDMLMRLYGVRRPLEGPVMTMTSGS